MSGWKPYVDRIEEFGASWAALVGKKEPQSVWYMTEGPEAARAETNDNLVKLAKDYSDFDTLRANGITLVPGIRYMVTKADDEFVHGRKGDQTVIALDFGDGIMVATHGSKVQTGNLVKDMTALADYLKETAHQRE
ncbi:profilin, required for normal timing of actin polymerization in response to thermal stress [Coemansia sp. RSA 1591]|nr:profilin, required for normal timing of actin polymerization in response to thermal stress [Coemansia sp. RSA 1591]KAJ1784408.1 profilin, required for normal timing of actin polymerization in response to thermal stress [Coemansia sp. RSA 1938]